MDEQDGRLWIGQVDLDGNPHGNGTILTEHEAIDTFLIDGKMNGLTRRYGLQSSFDNKQRYLLSEGYYYCDQAFGIVQTKIINGEGMNTTYMLGNREIGPDHYDREGQGKEEFTVLINSCRNRKENLHRLLKSSSNYFLQGGWIQHISLPRAALFSLKQLVIRNFPALKTIAFTRDESEVSQESGGRLVIQGCSQLTKVDIASGCFAGFSGWLIAGKERMSLW